MCVGGRFCEPASERKVRVRGVGGRKGSGGMRGLGAVSFFVVWEGRGGEATGKSRLGC